MRYIVYLLIAANLAYFAWRWYAPESVPEVTRPVPLPPGVDPLVLLSERSTAVARRADDAQDPAEEPGTQRAAAGEQRQETARAQRPERAAKVDQAAFATRPPVAEPLDAREERTCETLGPFLKKHNVTALFARLARSGYVVKVRDGDVREPAGYWVYLPATSAAEARRIVADLDARGMKDYYIGKRNYISLGIFSGMETAERRQREVARLGYDAILDQRFRTRDVFWLDIDEREDSLLASNVWEEIQAQHPDVRVQSVNCE